MADHGRPALPRRHPAACHRRCRDSNCYRLQKQEPQKFAGETGLEIAVSHFPPSTSKWKKIEHRFLSALTLNWRGKPLGSHEVIVRLIAATTTRTGLRIRMASTRPG